MKILIVEDQETMRTFMVRAVEQQGYACDVAEHGRECLEKCATQSYDLILLDLVMPILDGMGTLKVLRAKYPKTDVVVASVQDDDTAIQELMSQGATAYLCKPFTAQQLAQLVQKIEAKRASAGTS